MTTWANAFEASPADADAANQGANKIRELKTAISERLELEMNFKTGTKPLIKAGIASTCYAGNTAQIAALATPSNHALAYDTSLKTFKYYSAGWANAQLDHALLANLTGTDPHTQYLSLDKANQTIAANLLVANTITIDGVDISSFKTASDIVAAAFAAHVANKVAHANTFGAWDTTTYTVNSNYTANTDGFVVFSANTLLMNIQTPVNTITAQASSGSNYIHTLTCPVRKGATWRVYLWGTGANTVYWLPVGS